MTVKDKLQMSNKVIDKIIDHLKLTFKAERPPPPQAQLSMAAEYL